MFEWTASTVSTTAAQKVRIRRNHATAPALFFRQTEEARRVATRHHVDVLVRESLCAQRSEERPEPIRRQRVPLLAQVGREHAELRSNLPDGVRESRPPLIGIP